MDPITAYFQLVEARPELFAPSEQIPLCLEEERLRAFASETGRPVGLVYDNRPYYMVLADLCRRADGRLYTYARVVYPRSGSNGVVVVPCRMGRFGLLSIFRHPPRAESGGEFPRGFAEDLSPPENAAKELWEEIGARVDPGALVFLCEIQTDTGLSAGRVQVFCAQVEEAAVPAGNGEGIHGLRWVSEEDLREEIARGVITDGLTLAAYAQYRCWRERQGTSRPSAGISLH